MQSRPKFTKNTKSKSGISFGRVILVEETVVVFLKAFFEDHDDL